MGNKYLKNLEKLEFISTYACTGRCKHCSQGEHSNCSDAIDIKVTRESLCKILRAYDIKTVLVFGGEPLLNPEAVFFIINTAKNEKVPKRQVITNGFFSTDEKRISEVARELFKCGVNDLLVSVDAFHQETIPLETVRLFILEADRIGIPTRIQPAWLVSPGDDNLYNRKTREILKSLADIDVPVSEGNVVFPEGNALVYLTEYFGEKSPKNPYTEDPCNIKCLSFEPNGDVLDGNIYKKDIMEIIDNYRPPN